MSQLWGAQTGDPDLGSVINYGGYEVPQGTPNPSALITNQPPASGSPGTPIPSSTPSMMIYLLIGVILLVVMGVIKL